MRFVCRWEDNCPYTEKYFGNKIYTRGLIEFTNYCRNDCYYCGIRRSNRNASRYRLTKEEILQCARMAMSWDFGHLCSREEDPWFNDDRMVDIIRSIKQDIRTVRLRCPLGRKSKRKQRFKDAGADRYLLRHETASENIIVIFIRRV